MGRTHYFVLNILLIRTSLCAGVYVFVYRMDNVKSLLFDLLPAAPQRATNIQENQSVLNSVEPWNFKRARLLLSE